jgi:hypothetical protein
MRHLSLSTYFFVRLPNLDCKIGTSQLKKAVLGKISDKWEYIIDLKESNDVKMS